MLAKIANEDRLSKISTRDGKLPPAERRKMAALGAAAGRSNRTIAKELGVSEVTIRRDLKHLAMPEGERPPRVPRLKPVREQLLFHEMSADQHRHHLKRILKLARFWIVQEGFTLNELEEFILPEAGKHLYRYRGPLSKVRDTPESPEQLLLSTRPTRVIEQDMSAKLVFCAEWLARWLALCLPREQDQQEEVLRQISLEARS
jgi:hypothetical protein